VVGCRYGTSPRMEDGAVPDSPGGAGLQIQTASGWRSGWRQDAGQRGAGLQE
jgi:hypothetical protein